MKRNRSAFINSIIAMLAIVTVLGLICLSMFSIFDIIATNETIPTNADSIEIEDDLDINDKSKQLYGEYKQKINISKAELEEIPLLDVLNYIEEDNYESVIYYEKNQTKMYLQRKNGTFYVSNNPDYDDFYKDMSLNGVLILDFSTLFTPKDMELEVNNRNSIVVVLLIVTAIVITVIIVRRKASENEIKTFGRKVVVNGLEDKSSSNTVKSDCVNHKTFSDVAGLKEVKKDMKSLVDFLLNKDKYIEAGAKLPKGVILYGPPGTGKTLLAKAVAGEAEVPFLYMSGSDFIELYVGVGAKRIRELFDKAKKLAPCIIFIDEIDTIGAKRLGIDSGGENRKTINDLLTEMDGFNESENILVIAATNRLEDLDNALTRPGRFTNKYCVPLPETSAERLEIINLYNKNKKFAEDVDFDKLSRETIGFSPAQIESLLNEAAIISVQDRKKYIDKETIEKAMFKMVLEGHVRENQKERDKEELKVVAWHEAGHALIGKLNGKEVNKVTILASTSGAGGVTFVTPSRSKLCSVQDLKNEVIELYAGREAEMLLYNDKNKVTTGASNDIGRATMIINELVTKYGMSEHFGLLNLYDIRVTDDIIIDKEIELAKELEQISYNTLQKHIDKLQAIANELLAKETLYETDLDRIINEEA